MTIGVFSKRTRLSYKALRLYDAMGLLEPAVVDEQTAYRYYSEAQIKKAKLIALLRQLEMPLNNIADVVKLSDHEVTRAVLAYWQSVEEDMRNKRKLVHFLEHYLEGKGDSMFDIQTRSIEEQKVMSIESYVYVADLPGFISDAMGELYTYLEASGQEEAGDSFVVYHGEVTNDSDGPVEVCVPFKGSLEPEGRIRIRLEPAHQEAYTRIPKKQVIFPDILAAYDALDKYLKANNKMPSLSCREVYFADWDAVSDDELACDIAAPFEN